MDMASLIAAQQLLASAGTNLTASQQQQLLASMSSSLSQLSATQQQQLLSSLAGMSGQPQSQQQSQQPASVTGLTAAQQQLLAAAGTSLTSVSGAGKDTYSRASTPSTPTPTGTPRPTGSGTPQRPPSAATPTSSLTAAVAGSVTNNSSSTLPFVTSNGAALDPASQTKYQQLLSVIEEMSKDIRPCYAGSKSSAERLKRGIVYARILVRECLVEAERSART